MTDKKKTINKCEFCEKDLSKENFRRDYILVAWRDDPDETASFNKPAKCVHPKCLKRFVELNFDDIKKILLNLVEKS